MQHTGINKQLNEQTNKQREETTFPYRRIPVNEREEIRATESHH